MQQINLYQNKRSNTRSLQSIAIMASVALLFILIIAVYVMQLRSIDKLDQQLAKKQAELAIMEKSLEIIKQKARPAAQDMSLAIELENLKLANASKKRASSYLQGSDTGNLSGFSSLLEGLGRQRDTIEKLWLSKIKISDGGFDVQLYGNSYEANLLPEFVAALSDEVLYSNREFRQIKITRSESSEKILNFMLDTRHAESKLSDANRHDLKKRFMAMLRQQDEVLKNSSGSDDTVVGE